MVNLNPVEWYHEIKHVLRTTPAEILIMSLLGFFIATGYAYKKESERAKTIPLGFSEISQIERDAIARREEVGNMTRYLTDVNDAVMKIFECYNYANESTLNVPRRFASELETKMDPAFKIHHYELFSFFKALPEHAKKALEELAEFADVRRGMGPVNSSFSAAWDDSHIDHYRTVHYTVEVCDSNRHCHTESRTKQVYDHTTHTYTYHGLEGEEASIRLDTVLKQHPELVFKEKIRTASKTNAEGEDAAERSRKVNGSRVMMKLEDLLGIANIWYTGSTLSENLPVIYGSWKQLHTDADEWRKAKETSHNDSYNTSSHHDDGPKEFRTAESALDHGTTLTSSIGEILNGIEYVRTTSNQLDNTIKEFIAVELDYKEGNSRKLMNKVMDESKKWYKMNFKAGFDVDRFRWPLFVGISFLGMITGALLGTLWDYAGKRYKLYRE